MYALFELVMLSREANRKSQKVAFLCKTGNKGGVPYTLNFGYIRAISFGNFKSFQHNKI